MATKTDIQENPKPLADIADRIASLAERAARQNADRLNRWAPDIQAAGGKWCERHPAQPLEIDIEKSAHASDRANRLRIECGPCPHCEADKLRRREEKMMLARGVPPRSMGITLATWSPNWEPTAAESRVKALAAVSAWTQGKPPVPFLIILGAKSGTGKTALGVAAARAISRDLRILEFRDWIGDLLKLDPGEQRGTLESVRRYGVVMVDDFGNRVIGQRTDDGGNAFERDCMGALLNFRFENRLPTILTSNLDPAAFAARLDDRTVDRIRAGRVFVDASAWPSRRAADGI